jgi:hypothetical protein
MKYIIDKENYTVTIDGKMHSIHLLQKLISKETERIMFPPRFNVTLAIAKDFFEKYPEYLI